MSTIESGPVGEGDPKRRLARAAWQLATLGVVLRLIRYLQNYPLWCDESMLAANLLDRRWTDLAQPLDYNQVCPLGFLALAWTSVRELGFSELSLRLVPILCATASVPLFFLLARRMLGAGTVATLLAVGLFAVAQPPIRFAAEFKPYATDLLVATGLLLLAQKNRPAIPSQSEPRAGCLGQNAPVVQTRSHWGILPQAPTQTLRPFLALAVAAPLCVAVSLPSLFLLAPIAVVGFFEVVARRGRGLLLAYAAFLATTCATILAMAALGQYQTTPEARAYFLNFWSEGFPPSWRDPSALIHWLARVHTGPLFAYPQGPGILPSWLNAVFFAGFVIGIAVRGRRDLGEVALLVLPFVLTFAASVLRRYPYGMSPRVAQFLVPSTLLLTAAGVDWLIGRLRVEPLRRWAVPGLVGLLVALGGWRLAIGFIHPYRTPGDRTAREFARWFWEELGVDAELVCVQSDLGIPFGSERWSYDGADQYLCYQRIFSARHREGRPPRWNTVSPARPLRCVILNRAPDQIPGFVAWMEANRHRYTLRDVRIYPAFRGTHDEPGQFYVVCEFMPPPEVPLSATRMAK